jgi:hypothetical protein
MTISGRAAESSPENLDCLGNQNGTTGHRSMVAARKKRVKKFLEALAHPLLDMAESDL